MRKPHSTSFAGGKFSLATQCFPFSLSRNFSRKTVPTLSFHRNFDGEASFSVHISSDNFSVVKKSQVRSFPFQALTERESRLKFSKGQHRPDELADFQQQSSKYRWHKPSSYIIDFILLWTSFPTRHFARLSIMQWFNKAPWQSQLKT